MVAGLERHVGGSSSREIPCPLQRLRLGMRTASWLRPAAADDVSITHQHAADRRVRPDTAEATFGKRQGRAHLGDVGDGKPRLSGRQAVRRTSVLRLSKVPVDRGEADISYLIELRELLHRHLADDLDGISASPRVSSRL